MNRIATQLCAVILWGASSACAKDPGARPGIDERVPAEAYAAAVFHVDSMMAELLSPPLHGLRVMTSAEVVDSSGASTMDVPLAAEVLDRLETSFELAPRYKWAPDRGTVQFVDSEKRGGAESVVSLVVYYPTGGGLEDLWWDLLLRCVTPRDCDVRGGLPSWGGTELTSAERAPIRDYSESRLTKLQETECQELWSAGVRARSDFWARSRLAQTCSWPRDVSGRAP